MRVIDNEADEPLTINILPMIDVIFAILAFFIISTLFLTRSEGFSVDLPEAETAQSQTKVLVTVTIEQNGDISIDKEPVTLDQLAETVREKVGDHEGALVTVQADETIDYGRVIAVMDRVRRVEGTSLGMATQQPVQTEAAQ
ncbi:transport energizing protein, ExbD/TolR family [Synechococcus sp. PCC 7335]|uniref:ExbD/TolR family protein n=1 Tax=Synechococcus sp. (strain ATCC 29403 / PCC 7335) TaxID=91464 RepID=UPI00017EBC1C|nr:biopolymer transporter ExbD [Synechococcus sp. PCC 7335]EDX84382.1 transport energizing protein, ExbD/TolR family [Synechococcus sp. PCC 7335]